MDVVISGGDWASSPSLRVEDDLSRKGTAGSGQTQASGPKRREGGEAEEVNFSLWLVSRG